MKKILTLALALMLVLALAACGGNNDTPDPSGSGTTDPGTQQTDPGTSEPDETPTPDESSDDRFTEFGLSFEEVQPEGSTAFEVTNDSKRTYSVEFTMPDTVTEEFGFAYYKEIFDLTAAISEGGTNYKQTGGSAITPEVSPMGEWEDEHSAEAHMNVWFYKYDGKLLEVTILGGIGYDNVISVSVADYT